MDAAKADKFIQSAAVSCAIEGESVPLALLAPAAAYLQGKLGRDAFRQRVESAPSAPAWLFFRQIELLSAPPTLYHTDALLSVHKQLYGDLKPTAGKLRKVNLEWNGCNYTDYKYLKGSLRSILGRLSSVQGSPLSSKSEFAAALAHYMRELHILSPFEYGNGITRRTFFMLFCLSRGFDLSYAAVPKKDLIQAETLAFTADDAQPLFSLLTACLTYSAGQDVAPARTQTAAALVTSPARIKRGAAKPLKAQAKRAKPQTKATAVKAGRPKKGEPVSPDAPAPNLTNAEILSRVQSIQQKVNELSEQLDSLVKQIKS